MPGWPIEHFMLSVMLIPALQWSFGFYRLIETILGVGLAVAVIFVPKLIPVDKPKQDS